MQFQERELIMTYICSGSEPYLDDAFLLFALFLTEFSTSIFDFRFITESEQDLIIVVDNSTPLVFDNLFP